MSQESNTGVISFLKRHWAIITVLLIMVVAFLIRLYYLGRFSEYNADTYYYMILGRSLRESLEYTVRGLVHTKYLPGFPIAMWLTSYLTGSIENAAKIISLLCGTLTVLVTYGIGRELFDRKVGVLAALLIALQPTYLMWTSQPMTEGLFSFLFAMGVWLVLTGCKNSSKYRRLLGALAGGACFLVRWEGILFIPLAALIIWVYRREAKLGWWEPFAMLALCGGPIAIYAIRNLALTGSISSYVGEYNDYKPDAMSFSVLRTRFTAYAWAGFSSAFFGVLFYSGLLWTFLRRKYGQFCLMGAWFALFLAMHMFWYYAYERFMAPAMPAACILASFLICDVAAAFARPDEHRLEFVFQRNDAPERGISLNAPRPLRYAGLALVVILVSGLCANCLVYADNNTELLANAYADDHGGRGMEQAAEWLQENDPGARIAVDAGPYFAWLYDSGEIIYLRSVPWDLPVEEGVVPLTNASITDASVDFLVESGVKYFVLHYSADEDKAHAIVRLGALSEGRIERVALWQNLYGKPLPEHLISTEIFKVLPPGE